MQIRRKSSSTLRAMKTRFYQRKLSNEKDPIFQHPEIVLVKVNNGKRKAKYALKTSAYHLPYSLITITLGRMTLTLTHSGPFACALARLLLPLTHRKPSSWESVLCLWNEYVHFIQFLNPHLIFWSASQLLPPCAATFSTNSTTITTTTIHNNQ